MFDVRKASSLGFAASLLASSALAQVGAGAAGGGAPGAPGAGGPPIISSCGTGTPAFLGIASNLAGRIQTGGGATTSCTITWTNAQGVTTPRLAAPSCEAAAEQAATTLITLVPSVNSLVLTYTSTTAGVIDYHCDGV